MGVDAVDLEVSGTVQLNQTSRTDGERFEWSTDNGTLEIGSDVSLKVMDASASLNIGPGNVVAVIGSLTLTMSRQDADSGNPAIGIVTAADVLTLSVSGAEPLRRHGRGAERRARRHHDYGSGRLPGERGELHAADGEQGLEQLLGG